MIPGIISSYPIIGGAPAPLLTLIAQSLHSTQLTEHGVTGITIPNPTHQHWLLINGGDPDNTGSSLAISTCTLDGNAMTERGTRSFGSATFDRFGRLSIYSLQGVTLAGSSDLVITSSHTCGMAWALFDASILFQTTPTDTESLSLPDAGTYPVTLTIPAGGIAFALAGSLAGGTSAVLSGITEIVYNNVQMSNVSTHAKGAIAYEHTGVSEDRVITSTFASGSADFFGYHHRSFAPV